MRPGRPLATHSRPLRLPVMESQVDRAFDAGRAARLQGGSRWDDPWQSQEPTTPNAMRSCAWMLGWLRAEHDAMRAEGAALRVELRAELAALQRRTQN